MEFDVEITLPSSQQTREDLVFLAHAQYGDVIEYYLSPGHHRDEAQRYVRLNDYEGGGSPPERGYGLFKLGERLHPWLVAPGWHDLALVYVVGRATPKPQDNWYTRWAREVYEGAER